MMYNANTNPMDLLATACFMQAVDLLLVFLMQLVAAFILYQKEFYFARLTA